MKKQYFVLLLLVSLSNSLFSFAKNSQPLAVTVTNIVPVTCNGACDGSADVAFTGAGTGPYTIQWISGATTTFTNVAASPFTCTGLCAGNYTVRVIGTIMTQVTNIVISEPAPVLVTVDGQSNVNCYGGTNGSAFVSSFGGNGIYTYQWYNSSNVLIGNGSFQGGLIAGEYQCVVVDGNGCDETASVIITEPTDIVTNIVSQQNVTCYNLFNGNVVVQASGGLFPTDSNFDNAYTISIANPMYTQAGIPLNMPVQFSGLGVGAVGSTHEYTITVTDLRGCQDVATVVISQPQALVISNPIVTNLSCYQSLDGEVSVTVNGGTPLYSYSWMSSNPMFPNPGTSTISGLSAGSYTLSVTDENNCNDNLLAVVSEPAPISISIDTTHASSSINCDGIAIANVTGGTPLYTYTWVDPSVGVIGIGQSINNLCVGTYTLNVTDNNGCVMTSVFPIHVETIGLKEIQTLNASIFPNPTNEGSFKIQLNDASYKNLHFTMHNAAGTKVMDKNLPSQPVNEINTWGLTNGIYFYQLINADGKTYSGKIVIGN